MDARVAGRAVRSDRFRWAPADPPPRRGHLAGVGIRGCNRFTASYVLAGDRLTFGAIAAIRMACADGMDVERRFVAALADVTAYRVDGATLTLAGADGPLARFRAP